MIHTAESTRSLDEVCDALQEAVTKRQFGVMTVHNLRETMAKKGVEFGRNCRILEVCNPHQAKRVLESQMEISTALPCRISVYEEGDKVILATIKPSMMLQMFGGEGLEDVAEDVERVMVDSMAEAAG
ncbi:MAG: DUF302 domain-containing protein [Candidatus Latescibacteria bacterium]|jgi:uncharacterized protein (DUF302 family)|nr:DUF302 domain-containing protein [Candidatus Latescibacterota bacterium]